MSSGIKADIQRLDLAIRSGVTCPRALFRSGSSEAWKICLSSLKEAQEILLNSSFADRNSSAAIWIHWRKSGTSKQLLSLLRTAVAEAPGSPHTAGYVRVQALHAALGLISFLFKRSQYGMLWPAMREWISDQDGVQAIWQALAWSMASLVGDKAAHNAALREPIHAVIGLMSKPDGTQLTLLTILPSAHPSIIVALTLLLNEFLPRYLASGNAQEWSIRSMLGNVGSLSAQLGQVQPQPQLHRAFLVAWPYLMGWFRQQPVSQLTLQNQMVRH